jgi:hypothetical protein
MLYVLIAILAPIALAALPVGAWMLRSEHGDRLEALAACGTVATGALAIVAAVLVVAARAR